MLSVVKRMIPIPVKQKIRDLKKTSLFSAYMSVKRTITLKKRVRLFGALAPLVPEPEEMFDGTRSFEAFKSNGEEFLKIYKEICGLMPGEKMLDVGCGIGRKTLPLTQYFDARAVYEGIDIASAGIVWCRDKITPRFPNFHFQQINVYNKVYNPLGEYQPSRYAFPFSDGFFDFVMLGSVFTHMLPDDLENYLSEVSRVLRRGGRCLISYFLLNAESLPLLDSGDSTQDLKYALSDTCRTTSLEAPEESIAFDEHWIRELYGRLGLNVSRIEYGSWCARENYLSYQDLVLATKEGK